MNTSSDKITLMIAFLLASAVIATPPLFDGFFPHLNILLVIFLFFVTTIVVTGKYTNDFVLISAVSGFAIIYLITIHVYTPSPIGTDVNYIEWIHNVIETGNDDGIGSEFYRRAPLFINLSAIFGIITQQAATTTIIIYALLTGIIVPTTIYAISRVITNDGRIPLLAMAIAPFSAQVISYAQRPIAQVIFFFYFLVFIHIFFSTMNRPSKRFGCLLIIFASLSLFSHKMSLMVISIVLFGAFVSHWSANSGQNSSYLLLIISSSLLFVQWFHMTDYANRVISRILLISSSPDLAPSIETQYAVPAHANLSSVISHSANLLVLYAIAGCAWIIFCYWALYRDRSTEISVLLGITAVCAGIVVLSVFATGSNPSRFNYLAEPILLILSITFIVKFSKKRVYIVSVVILIALSMAFVAPAIPDYPDTTRSYLTQGEITGKEFANNHIHEPIYTDGYYAHRPIPSEINGDSVKSEYASIDMEVLEGRIDNDYKYIAHRTDNDIYQTSVGAYKLKWDIEHAFKNHNKAYSNNNVEIYVNQN